jgi:hypothetical protein
MIDASGAVKGTFMIFKLKHVGTAIEIVEIVLVLVSTSALDVL